MSTATIHFNSMKVEGYRGRNFELKMKPEGKHSVFIMDGNTGKTTLIELLRWCFMYRQDQAKGKFKHMWNDPAHVLDHNKSGNQTCTITVNFSAGDHNYSFRRVTKGVYAGERGEKGILIEKDDIHSIEDSLEVDNGIEVYNGDEASVFMNSEFRFAEGAEYFCFDGEKAKEVMMQSAKQSEIHVLLDIVNKRVTHHKLEEYRNRLERLKKRVYSEAKARASKRPTHDAIEQSLNEIMEREEALRKKNEELASFKSDILTHEKALIELGERKKSLDDEIIKKASENLIRKKTIQMEIDGILGDLEKQRGAIYKNCLSWIKIESPDLISQIKNKVRESGNLPEPYREELIRSCLKSDPPTCQICGQKLTEKEIKRIKELGRLIAPHHVHTFLTSNFNYEPSSFDAYSENKGIETLTGRYMAKIDERDKITLSEKDLNLVEKGKELDKLIGEFNKSKGASEELASTLSTKIKAEEEDLKTLKEKSRSLRDYELILRKIDETRNVIDETQDKMTDATIDIISEVISSSVETILGPKFSAVLTKDSGLLLGEDGVHSTEMGGMSGRLILSYCFAEAVTRIDPIIVDTPSGNIGSVRPELAEHLAANHSQVILLCLPKEVEDFADHIADPRDFVEIKNRS